MVRAWYMDTSDADQRLEHHLDPEEYINMDDLSKSTGVLYFKVYSLKKHLKKINNKNGT